MKKAFLIMLAALFTVSSIIFTGCNNSRYSYWQINKLVGSTDENDVMTQYVEVYLEDNTLKEFWLNISGLNVTSTTIGYVFGASTSLKKTTIERSFLNLSDGWYMIEASGTSRTFKITFTDAMRVNEIVFINEKDEVMEFEFEEYVIRPSFTSSQHQTFTKEQLEEAGEANSPLCAFDEQDKFDLSYATKMFEDAQKATKE